MKPELRQTKRLPLIRFSAARLRRLRKVRGVFMQVLVLCGVKIGVHFFGLERLSVNQLFSAMVASTIFLLGFLLNGVLTDFKESEKIPAELATSLQTLNLEIQAIQAYHPEAQIAAALAAVTGLGQSLLDWLKERISTEQMLACHAQTHAEVVRAAVQFKGDASTLRAGPPKSVSTECWRGLAALALVGGNGSPPCPKSQAQQLISLIPTT